MEELNAPPPTPPLVSPSSRNRHLILWGSIGVSILVIVVVAGFSLYGSSYLRTQVLSLTGQQTLTLTDLSPESAPLGNSSVTVTVTGSGFVPTSRAFFNSFFRPTTYVSPTQLTFTLPLTGLTTGTPYEVKVVNGGLTSNSRIFWVSSTVTSLSPATAAAGDATFSITVNGNGFNQGSHVVFKTSTLPTTYVSSTRLTATINPEDIPKQGNYSVAVNDGDTISNTVQLVVGPKSLTLSRISPASVEAGNPGFTLTLYGTGFTDRSEIISTLFNEDRKATYVSPTELRLQIPASVVATVPDNGNHLIFYVHNPSSTGGFGSLTDIANRQYLEVVPKVFSVSRIEPSRVDQGGDGLSLLVIGAKFVQGAKVHFNGQPRDTTYISSTQLSAQLSASDFKIIGDYPVTVTSPAPAGGSTTAKILKVVTPEPDLNTSSSGPGITSQVPLPGQ